MMAPTKPPPGSPRTLTPLKTFSAVHVTAGSVRRIYYEAANAGEAHELAMKWNIGLEGEAMRPESAEPPPEAFNEETTRRLLGGISESTLYREIVRGNLERVPGIRKLLVTRKSIERWPYRRN